MLKVMKWGFLLGLFAILAPGTETSAQNRRANRTVSECAQDLSREVFSQLNAKKAEKYCRDYSQRTIDCATQIAQTKVLTFNFDKALADCNRRRDRETEY